MDESRVAYLGPAGTFSHRFAIEVFGGPDHGFAFTACRRFEEVRDRVHAGDCGLGVLPYLTMSGNVHAPMDLVMGRHRDGLALVAAAPLPIELALLGCGPLPGVRRVYSKREALRQCRDRLARLVPNAELIATDSTTAGAERALRDGPSAAAVADALLSESFSALQVLADRIQDRPDNRTRFVVIAGQRLYQRHALAARPITNAAWLTFIDDPHAAALPSFMAAAHDAACSTYLGSTGCILDAASRRTEYHVECRYDRTTHQDLDALIRRYGDHITHCDHLVDTDGIDERLRALRQRFRSIPNDDRGGAFDHAAVADFLRIDPASSVIEHEPIHSLKEAWAVTGTPLRHLLNVQLLAGRTGTLAVACLPGDRRLQRSGTCCLEPEPLHRATAHEMRRLPLPYSPILAHHRTLLLDESLQEDARITVSAGTPTTSIRTSVGALTRHARQRGCAVFRRALAG
ncbi:MAG: prephenate dehydratase domain-containing protein [Planctomycetota bacterium]